MSAASIAQNYRTTVFNSFQESVVADLLLSPTSVHEIILKNDDRFAVLLFSLFEHNDISYRNEFLRSQVLDPSERKREREEEIYPSL